MECQEVSIEERNLGLFESVVIFRILTFRSVLTRSIIVEPGTLLPLAPNHITCESGADVISSLV
jgi:hypothetical protein